ncbi:hypothetical protein JTE90_019481 [Oedothorax gibbosus]|uniref:Uncharacterized protein n=1 Tax=Oedothorax gibbosus TaxID=931172 RepID=A0AAV6UIY9_9ARAC|nr:hypothetical protein JTE90_019481 [Oedothorax gibbosus]
MRSIEKLYIFAASLRKPRFLSDISSPKIFRAFVFSSEKRLQVEFLGIPFGIKIIIRMDAFDSLKFSRAKRNL